MNKQNITLIELCKFEALNTWIHFIKENPQLNLSFNQKDDKWDYVFGEFSLSLPNKSFTENNKQVQKDLIFYVDFAERSLKIKNAECFTKDGVKIGEISDTFIKQQNINAILTERETLQKFTVEIKKSNEFDKNFKF